MSMNTHFNPVLTALESYAQFYLAKVKAISKKALLSQFLKKLQGDEIELWTQTLFKLQQIQGNCSLSTEENFAWFKLYSGLEHSQILSLLGIDDQDDFYFLKRLETITQTSMDDIEVSEKVKNDQEFLSSDWRFYPKNKNVVNKNYLEMRLSFLQEVKAKLLPHI